MRPTLWKIDLGDSLPFSKEDTSNAVKFLQTTYLFTLDIRSKGSLH